MKFLAVDISSVFRRYWEAAQDDAFGVARTRSVTKVLEVAEGYDRIVIARDPPASIKNGGAEQLCASFRHALYAGYKAGRKDPGEAFRDQLKATVEELKGRGATSWASPKLGTDGQGRVLFGEGDDVLSTFAYWYQEKRGEDWHLRILSGDTDLWALVDDSIAIDVLTLDGKIVNAQAVNDRFGVDPHLVPEVKALAGDDSDRFKPFEHPEKNAKGDAKAGVGPSFAAKIVLADVERQEGDRSGADGVLRVVMAGGDPGIGLNAPAIFCLRHHGPGALDLGRRLAYMRPDLEIDFTPVLDEPKRAQAKPQAPPMPAEIVPEAPRGEPLPSTALAIPSQVSTAIVHGKPDAYALEPRDMSGAMMLAQEMYNSGLFRKNLPNPASCLMVIGMARAMSVPVFVAAQHAYVVHGRLSWSAQFMMAVIIAHPSTKRFAFDPRRCDDRAAVVKFHREGYDPGEYPFTIQQAQTAGYLGGSHSEQWKKRPAVMLRWAAARECARAYWPDVIGGMYGPDEIGREGMTDDPGGFPLEMTQEA